MPETKNALPAGRAGPFSTPLSVAALALAHWTVHVDWTASIVPKLIVPKWIQVLWTLVDATRMKSSEAIVLGVKLNVESI